jgi:hypothetical protein
MLPDVALWITKNAMYGGVVPRRALAKIVVVMLSLSWKMERLPMTPVPSVGRAVKMIQIRVVMALCAQS